MLGAVMHAPGDVQVETRPDPQIIEPTDAIIIRVSAACICGSDLWPWRGIEKVGPATPMVAYEYVGVVKEVGSDVASIKPGQFVIGSFFASDNTCEICRAGYQSRCVNAGLIGRIGTQAEYARIPLADGTLVATPELPPADLIAACWPPPMCWAPAGSAPSPPRPGPARQSLSSVTVRSDCSG